MSKTITVTTADNELFNIGDRVAWVRTNMDHRKDCSGVIIGWYEPNITPIILVEPDADGITAIVIYLSSLTKVQASN